MADSNNIQNLVSPSEPAKTVKNETTLRNCFSAWQKRDWDFVESILTDDFTFTSPYDDHINKQEYKHKCWDAVTEIEAYEFITIIEKGNEAFVWYRSQINGIPVQNTEHFLFHNRKIKAIDVFFGRPESFPSQVNP